MLRCRVPRAARVMWAAARVVQQLLGLCGVVAFPEHLLIVEPTVLGLLSLASTGGGSSCGIPGCKGFVAMLRGIPEISSGDTGGCEE